MKFATQLPTWVILTFSLFCLFQVTTWLEEVKEFLTTNKNNITWLGQKYISLPNRSFIVDESLAQYGIQLNYHHTLN